MVISIWGKPLPEPEPRRPSAGPWTSHDTDEGEWVVDIPNDGAITVTRLYFGDMEDNTGRDIANADLVAAAPDLLEACRRAEEECGLELMRLEAFGDRNGMLTRTYTDLRDLLRAAIARAAGEA